MDTNVGRWGRKTRNPDTGIRNSNSEELLNLFARTGLIVRPGRRGKTKQSRSLGYESVQPVFDLQAGHLGEVGCVAGPKDRVVHESDAGDLLVVQLPGSPP